MGDPTIRAEAWEVGNQVAWEDPMIRAEVWAVVSQVAWEVDNPAVWEVVDSLVDNLDRLVLSRRESKLLKGSPRRKAGKYHLRLDPGLGKDGLSV